MNIDLLPIIFLSLMAPGAQSAQSATPASTHSALVASCKKAVVDADHTNSNPAPKEPCQQSTVFEAPLPSAPDLLNTNQPAFQLFDERIDEPLWVPNSQSFPRTSYTFSFMPSDLWHTKASKRKRQAKPSIKAPIEELLYGKILVPALEQTRDSVFRKALDLDIDMGRLSNLKRAMQSHEQSQPANWSVLVEAVKKERQEQGTEAALRLANSLINQIPYVDGTDGTFFSPARLFGRGGVCKDYVVAKYLLLKEAGFDVSALRIIVVSPNLSAERSSAHVVLAYNNNTEDPWVLDLANQVHLNEFIKTKNLTRAQYIKHIGASGLTEITYNKKLDNFSSISAFNKTNFGGRRGLEWSGNEYGGAFFGRSASVAVAKNKQEGNDS